MAEEGGRGQEHGGQATLLNFVYVCVCGGWGQVASESEADIKVQELGPGRGGGWGAGYCVVAWQLSHDTPHLTSYVG